MRSKRNASLTVMFGWIFCLGLLGLAGSASAYILKTWRWPSPRATYTDSSLPSAWKTIVRAAAEEWEDTRAFDWDRSSSSQNKLWLERIDGSGGTLARTTHADYGNFLYRVGIKFDSAESWHTSTSTPPSSKYDALSVATHEFGHAVGIDHPQDSLCGSSVPKSRRPTMCQHSSASDAKKNDTHRRSLETDDENAIKAQYNKTAGGTVSSLPAGQERLVCVESEWAFQSQEDRAREAQALVAGVVIEVSPTLWNSDDGRYWGDDESFGLPMPYHVVTLSVNELLFDEKAAFTGSPTVLVHVPAMSPVDSMSCGVGSVGPFEAGQEVAIFLEKGTLAWQTGAPRTFIQTVNEPRNSALIKSGDGLFYEMNGPGAGMELSELHRRVHELRDPTER